MAIRKGKAYTISFPLIDNSDRPARKSGLTFSAGECKISKDGAAFSNTTNLPSEISFGRYSLALTAAEMAADYVHVYISKSGVDDLDMQFGTAGYESATVVTDGGNTATTFKTDRSSSTTDDVKDTLLVFTSGTLSGQVKKVSAFNGSTKFVTASAAFTGTPSSGDRFILVNI